jgi:SPP1 family phage portal protein
MYLLSKETELNEALLQKVIENFKLNEQPRLKKWKNYYDGKHAILHKAYQDATKPCNKIVTNYCKIITDSYSGYIAGKPITYTSNDDITDVQEAINYNDSDAEDIIWLTNTLTYGVGYELQWLDKDAQVRYGQIDPINCFAIYDNSLDQELLYFVRWYSLNNFDNSDKVCVEVYDAFTKKTYHCRGLGSSLEFIGEEVHHFGDVPVSVFWLNDNEESIFSQAITLNDAYNELQSSEVDDFQAWVDAYLTLTGCDLDEEDVAGMKTNRVLLLPEGANAQWLTKSVSDTQIENMLENLRKNIFKVTACPDMSDENFMAQSGEAIKYKIVAFENNASGIVARFTKAIQRRIELICNVLNLKASEAVWRDININFVRNLPQNYTEIINLVNSLKGTVSDETLLGQIPFITDVQSELEAVKKQKQESANMYGFGNFGFGLDEEEDEAV